MEKEEEGGGGEREGLESNAREQREQCGTWWHSRATGEPSSAGRTAASARGARRLHVAKGVPGGVVWCQGVPGRADVTRIQ